MLKFLLILIVLFFFWYKNAKKKKSFICPSSILLGIYVVSAIFCIPTLYNEDYLEPFFQSYWWPSFVFLISLLVLLMPARIYKENAVTQIVLPNKRVLDIMAFVLIILSVFSILYYSRTVSNIFSMNLGEARTELYLGTEYVEAGLVNTIASVSASLYVFVLLLFFIYCTIPSSKALRVILLLSSLSEPLHILAYVGRDGVVFWFFSFIFLFAFFRPYMEPGSKKFFKRIFIVAASVMLIPFLLITFSRFGSGGISSAFNSIVNYWGQGYIQGVLFMGIDNPPITHGGSFPLFWEITGFHHTSTLQGMTQIGEWRSWFFGTIVTSLYLNFGKLGFWLIAITTLILFFLVMKKKSTKLLFHQIIYYILYYQIMSQGIFYFKQYTRGGNLFIIITLLLVLFFRLTYNTENAIRINKKS